MNKIPPRIPRDILLIILQNRREVMYLDYKYKQQLINKKNMINELRKYHDLFINNVFASYHIFILLFTELNNEYLDTTSDDDDDEYDELNLFL